MAVASLAVAYGLAAASYLAVTILLTQPKLDRVFQLFSSLIPPDWVWRMGRLRFRSYSIFHVELDPVQLTLLVPVVASLLLVVHLAVFVAVDSAYRWRGRPPYWSEFRHDEKTWRRIALESLKTSAWRSAFALPLATGAWAIWYGVSQASIATNPALLMRASPAFLLNCVALLLIYFFVTSAMLRRSVLHEVIATGPRCVECGYILGHLKASQCSECGATFSAASRPTFEIRICGFIVLGTSAWQRIGRWLIVGLLLFMPLLIPVVGGITSRFFLIWLPRLTAF